MIDIMDRVAVDTRIKQLAGLRYLTRAEWTELNFLRGIYEKEADCGDPSA